MRKIQNKLKLISTCPSFRLDNNFDLNNLLVLMYKPEISFSQSEF
jgi:hypothetical protein